MATVVLGLLTRVVGPLNPAHTHALQAGFTQVFVLYLARLRQPDLCCQLGLDFPCAIPDVQDFKEMFVQYRARLSSIVRHAAAVLPEQALAAAQRRLDAAVAACSPGSGALAACWRFCCCGHCG